MIVRVINLFIQKIYNNYFNEIIKNNFLLILIFFQYVFWAMIITVLGLESVQGREIYVFLSFLQGFCVSFLYFQCLFLLLQIEINHKICIMYLKIYVKIIRQYNFIYKFIIVLILFSNYIKNLYIFDKLRYIFIFIFHHKIYLNIIYY